MATVCLRMTMIRTASGEINQCHMLCTIVILIVLLLDDILTYIYFHILIGSNLKRWQ